MNNSPVRWVALGLPTRQARKNERMLEVQCPTFPSGPCALAVRNDISNSSAGTVAGGQQEPKDERQIHNVEMGGP
jgi:hypothetical protein